MTVTVPYVLPIEKGPNFRDLGGYQATDGRTIKYHKLIRSGRMNKLSDQDLAFLTDYGVRTIIDLRSPKEKQQWPDRVPAGARYELNSIFPTDENQVSKSIVELRKLYDKDPVAGFMNMVNTYRDMVSRGSAQRAFHHFFEILCAHDQDNDAVLYHCTSGKDRTGMATVYLLTVLGIPAATIRADYLLSNPLLHKNRRDRLAALRAADSNSALIATTRSLASVRNEYLDAALVKIEDDYGSLPDYIENQLGVDNQMQAQLRQIYLKR
jgi:protein-tyrosine phosphatase